MAKLALVNRDKKRREAVKKYATKRAELIATTQNTRLSDEERYNARMLLQQLPRNASPVRLRTRLAQSFKYIVSQRLVPTADNKGRIAAVEILRSTPR